METEKNKQPDYKTIQELSHRMDCMINKADFDTTRPNTDRINTVVSDINRYLKRKKTRLERM